MKDLKIVDHNSQPKFRPVEVSFTITSEEELKELWCRLNLNKALVNRHQSEENKFLTSASSPLHFYSLWEQLDNVKRSLGL